jgi:hypothetical protein
MRGVIVLSMIFLPVASAQTIDVRDDATLRAALARLGPGVTVRLAPGEYRGGLFVESVEGPCVIEGADPERPPVIIGGGTALHLADANQVTLRRLVVRGATDNGINVDDGGSFDTPCVGLVVEDVRIERIGPTGNHDALKLSGLRGFTVRGCTFEGWGGSAVDMVGCHEGTIEGCRFTGVEGCSQDTGVQCKGGTSRVTIRRCAFVNAGARAINAGGSTGLPYFRPQDADCEARALVIEGNRFEGSQAPIAFVGVDGCVVRFNTFVRPTRWVVRILQESTDARFVPCRDGRFEKNIVVFRRAELSTIVNVGPSTRPETFVFAENLWFCEDAPARSRPDLPAPIPAEERGTYGVDPQAGPQRVGADALPDERRAR